MQTTGTAGGCDCFWYPIFVSFGKLGYQMATKKGGKPLGRSGCKICQILDGYQLATKGTFSYEKVPFLYKENHSLSEWFKKAYGDE